MRSVVLRLVAVAVLAIVALGAVSSVSAHPHTATHSENEQVLANGQNHPGFTLVDGLAVSCDDALVPADDGPAGWGLEVAHHGPDQGTPGKADGCYATEADSLPPPDRNPAIH